MYSSTCWQQSEQKVVGWTWDNDEGVLYLHEDALTITINIESKRLNMILVDSGSSIDIFFKSTLDKIEIADLRMKHINIFLKGFK